MATDTQEHYWQTPVRQYVGRMRGRRGASMHPQMRPSIVVTAFIGCFVGVYLIAVPEVLNLSVDTKIFLIGSFGASATLLFGAPRAPVAQPRSLLLGQLIAAFFGVTAFKLLGSDVGLAAGAAVAFTTAVMLLSGSLHPPAGATALIAVLGPAKVHSLGYLYILSPVLIGACILLVVALLVNNLSSDENRHYPVAWW
jgi:CBS domain-containing membrane protein